MRKSIIAMAVAGAMAVPMLTHTRERFCHHCEKPCKVITDKYCGKVSQCCGVGFSYENATGEVIDVNSDLRYISDWNE